MKGQFTIIQFFFVIVMMFATQGDAIETSNGQIINESNIIQETNLIPENNNHTNSFNAWTTIQGLWNKTSIGLVGGSNNASNSAIENIIVSPFTSSNNSHASTSFIINNADDQSPNYASIVYSFVNSENYRQAGINIFNNSVYILFSNTVNGTLYQNPPWPGINTNISWAPGDQFNLSLDISGRNHTTNVNGIDYTFEEKSNNMNGAFGLSYGRIKDINFLNFTGIKNNEPNSFDLTNVSNKVDMRDSQFISLNEHEIPAGGYIHLYDALPYKITKGHVSLTVPCDGPDIADINLLVGQVPFLIPIAFENADAVSQSNVLCSYRIDLNPVDSFNLTDIAIGNNSTSDIEFPESSSILLDVSQISGILK